VRTVLFQACLIFCVSVSQGAAADRVIVRGDNEYQPLKLNELSSNTQIDLNGTRFRVAISGNDNPTEAANCDTGNAPLNRYPFAVLNSPDVAIDGGLFAGEAPLTSDWLHTYCNSTAVRLETSPGATVREMRIRRAWDGIRIGRETSGFRLSRVWMSEVRDDCIENDHLMPGRIRDSLLDGCFAGISVAPVDDDLSAQPMVEIVRVLLRMKQYPYRGELRHALPIKLKRKNAKFNIRDSVFAVETTNLIGAKNIQLMWESIAKCRDNKLLWLGEGELPEIYAGAPKCFTIVTGAQAHEIWAKERQNWIADNKGVARFTTDVVQ